MGSTTTVTRHSAQEPRISFLSLPNELRTHIIGLACLPASPDGSLDYATISSLMLTARHIHIYGAKLLYRTIRITKPSVLFELVFALTSRPELGALIQTLHLGPERHHDREWWPMAEHGIGQPDVRSGEVRLISTSLEDEEVLPRWCGARRCFVLNSNGESDHHDAAVLRSIEAAEHAFGIDLKRPRHSPAGEEIGSTRWLVGVLEAQSVLDLYLRELRRLEDESGQEGLPCKADRYSRESLQHSGPRLDYPLLLLSESPAGPTPPQNDSTAQVFQVSRATVLEHLARRGGPADNFDHPLLLARSGLQILEIDDAGQASATSHAMLSDSEEWESILPAPSIYPSSPRSPDRECAPSTASEILALGRSLLARSPQVQHLFLSGFLQHIIAQHQPHCPLSALRSLFLGPFSHCHGDSLASSPALGRFANLKRLHMRGRRFAKEKVASILELPRLRDVVWELQYAEGTVEDALAAVRPLFAARAIQRPAAAPEGESQPARHTSSTADWPTPPATLTDAQKPPRVKLLLNERCRIALDAILTDEARAAWQLHQPLCETPFQLLKIVLESCSGVWYPRWDAVTGEAGMGYITLGEEWERALAGKKARTI